MKRLPYLLALAFMILVLFVPNAWAQGQNVAVSMEDNFFDGADITVPVGTTVTWVQNGDNPHTTTSYDGLWDSGLIAGDLGERSRSPSTNPGRTRTSAGRTRHRAWWAPLPSPVAEEEASRPNPGEALPRRLPCPRPVVLGLLR